MHSIKIGIPTYQPLGIEHVCPINGKNTYSPIVDESLKPQVGMVFDDVEKAYHLYERYAIAGGFTIKRGAQYTHDGIIKNKHFYCSKEGFKPSKPFDTLKDQEKITGVRRVPSIRNGCEAQIRLKLDARKKYVLHYFKEDHTHGFVHEQDRHLLSSARGLTYTQEEAISALGSMNQGPVKAFNIMRALYGGFDKVGATKSDFKNFKKDINLYIGEYDAEMVVKRLKRKQEYLTNFTCEYTTTDDGVLKGLFWADDEAKRNFYTFDDVVSFDATYRRNKLVPFVFFLWHYCEILCLHRFFKVFCLTPYMVVLGTA